MGMSANFIIYICMYSYGLKMTLNQNDTLWIPKNTRGNTVESLNYMGANFRGWL